MGIKALFGRMIFGKLDADLATFGEPVETRLIEMLNAKPLETFAHLLDLKNLDGESTGYVRTYSAERMDKLACLSINILPGMRYFNIHAIPDHRFMIPRFSFEGMITTRGSQVSMDLYPDIDMVREFDVIRDNYIKAAKSWQAARQHKTIRIEPSRLAHLRAICSPYFLLANKVQAEDLGTLQSWAFDYLDNWKRMYDSASELDDEAAVARLERRRWTARTIIENDPDRDKVVDTYGEETTKAIEEAAML